MRESLSISLTPAQAAFVDACVDTGRFQSASEVLRAGLRLLADEEAKRQAELEAVRSLVQAGADSLDRESWLMPMTFLALFAKNTPTSMTQESRCESR